MSHPAPQRVTATLATWRGTTPFDANGYAGLSFVLHPSGDILRLNLDRGSAFSLSETIADALRGVGQPPAEAAPCCTAESCIPAWVRMPYARQMEEVTCSCAATLMKEGALPPTCKSPARVQAWLASQTPPARLTSTHPGCPPPRATPCDATRGSSPHRDPSSDQTHCQSSSRTPFAVETNNATTAALDHGAASRG